MESMWSSVADSGSMECRTIGWTTGAGMVRDGNRLDDGTVVIQVVLLEATAAACAKWKRGSRTGTRRSALAAAIARLMFDTHPGGTAIVLTFVGWVLTLGAATATIAAWISRSSGPSPTSK